MGNPSWWFRLRVALAKWIVWRMPRRLVYFAGIRMSDNAVVFFAGKPYEEIGIQEAIGAWHARMTWWDGEEASDD